jgi:hypothetical protein
MNCVKLHPCPDTKKGFAYVCNSHVHAPSADQLWDTSSIVIKPAKALARANSSFSETRDESKNELDLIAMLDDIYDVNNNVMRDLKVDDRDLPEFPNFWDFTFSKQGLDAPLFSRQLYACLMLLHEICTTCSNPKYVKHIKEVPLAMKAQDFPEHFQLMSYGKCLKCGKTKHDHFKAGTLYAYQELAGLAGQRVGKSLITAALSAYLTHKVLKLQDPSRVYGILNTTLVGTLVGLTYNAAYEQLWLPYKNFLETSPFFIAYHEMLKSVGDRHGEELYKLGQTGVHYHHRNHLVYPSGPNKKTLRGKTRIFAAIDEMDFFNNDEDGEDQVKMNGVEVYKSLNNSLLTVRVGWKNNIRRGLVNVPNAYQFNISSPQSARGVLTETVNRNQDSKRVYCFHLATWEMNPVIGRRDLAQEFADNPEKAARDFGAEPPLADSPFMGDVNVVKDLFDKKPNAVKYTYVHRKNAMGVTRRAGRILSIQAPREIPPSILAIDAGFSNNSFSLTVGHADPLGEVRRVRCVAMVEIIPEKNTATLDYSAIAEKLIYPIIEGLNVQAVFADRWNSLKLLHDIEAKYKIPAEQYSIKYRDFTMIRSYMEADGVLLPRTETEPGKLDGILKPDLTQYPRSFHNRPVDHFFLQACTVKDTDRDVIKGTRLTDDTWRALCLMTHWLLDEKFCNEHLKYSTSNSRRGGLGAVSGMGGVTGLNGWGNLVAGGDAKTMFTVGATSGGLIGSGSLNSLYAIAAGGVKRDTRRR